MKEFHKKRGKSGKKTEGRTKKSWPKGAGKGGKREQEPQAH